MKQEDERSPLHIALYRADFSITSVSGGIRMFFARWPELREDNGADVPDGITAFVRDQVALYRLAGESEASALYLPTLLLRAFDLDRAGERLVAVVFAPFAVRDPVQAASKKFKLTDRERQVLTLVLTGMRASEIAAKLGLSEMTVGDYFKRLRAKTAARTQSGMIATLLGWYPHVVGAVDVENAG